MMGFYIAAPTAPLHAAPDSTSEMVSEMLHGEGLDILSTAGDWAKVKSQRDGYEGFLHSSHYADGPAPTHQVTALRTILYDAPDFKRPPVLSLPFLARVGIKNSSAQNGFVETAAGQWIWEGHIAPLTAIQPDFVETALKFLGTPYLWGGRTAIGIDCSGLVQAALLAAGIACPRDTKDQISIGTAIPPNTPPKRGELVFFERHVGIMVDNTRIFNATARTMDARIEKLDEMAAQYNGGILARREI